MIYPKGLSRNSSCLTEIIEKRSPIRYKLPLRGCNTMSTYLVSVTTLDLMVKPFLKILGNLKCPTRKHIMACRMWAEIRFQKQTTFF